MTFTSKTLDDGQTIYIVGNITRQEFISFIDPGVDMEFGYSITENVIHNVLRRRFKAECDPLAYKWITSQNVELTYSVDKTMFKQTHSANKLFEWGFGFVPGCSIESMFVLKWV